MPGNHPDRIRWNARYAGGFMPSFASDHEKAVAKPLNGADFTLVHRLEAYEVKGLKWRVV